MVWWEFPAAFHLLWGFCLSQSILMWFMFPLLLFLSQACLNYCKATRKSWCFETDGRTLFFFFLVVKLIVNLLLSLFIRIRCFTICCNLFWLRNLVFFFMETCWHPCLLGFPGWEQGYCCCKSLSGFGLGETAEELVFPLEKPGIMDHTACHCQGS